MPSFSHKGVTYHISMWGEKNKAPLILLHGFAQSSDTWKLISKEMTEHRFVVAPDFIGHGKSDKPIASEVYEMGAIKEWLTALIQWMEFECVDLLGYSMGGRIALSFAMSAPQKVASLVLESAGLGSRTAQQHQAMVSRDNELIDKLTRSSLDDFMDEWEDLPLFESQKNLPLEVRESLRKARMQNDPQALAFVVRGAGQHTMPDYSQDICLLPMPILYIAGILDRNYQKIAESLQSCEGITCVTLNAGHNTHLEVPEAFIHQVKVFLQDSSPLSKE